MPFASKKRRRRERRDPHVPTLLHQQRETPLRRPSLRRGLREENVQEQAGEVDPLRDDLRLLRVLPIAAEAEPHCELRFLPALSAGVFLHGGI